MRRAVKRLSVTDHDRGAAGMTWVYPVVSRRAGGVSIGVNLNPNRACNWRCIYCQVPGLTRGVAPIVDPDTLAEELRRMLDDALHGDFMRRCVPEGCRQVCDVAISGDGEPTSCCDFDAVVGRITEVMDDFGLAVPIRLITNGSYVHRAHVRRGLARMAARGGEVWIKLDRASLEGMARINGVRLDPARQQRQIETVARLCPAWIQTCMFAIDGMPPPEAEVAAYLSFLERLKSAEVPLRGVWLYGLARPSMQPEAGRLSPLPRAWMEALAARIRKAGWPAHWRL
ncbi:MAG: radical SAM protein [Mariprofundaceae bacterium]